MSESLEQTQEQDSFWNRTWGKIQEGTATLGEKTKELGATLGDRAESVAQYIEESKIGGTLSDTWDESVYLVGKTSEKVKKKLLDTQEESAVCFVNLGIAQDGGWPHVGCSKPCCQSVPFGTYFRSSGGLVDRSTNQRWLFDCTPDFGAQLRLLHRKVSSIPTSGATSAQSTPPRPGQLSLDGIFLTHGHPAHYAGLVDLLMPGMNTSKLPVYVMPRMKELLQANEPFNFLVRNEHIELIDLADGVEVRLTSQVTVTPFVVPHRDHDSNTETVGFTIRGQGRSLVYLPDLDSWETFGAQKFLEMVKSNDHLLIDGTFLDHGELVGSPHRLFAMAKDIRVLQYALESEQNPNKVFPSQFTGESHGASLDSSAIEDQIQMKFNQSTVENARQGRVPHPTITETIVFLLKQDMKEKEKIHFIHLNHTNPAIKPSSKERRVIQQAGHRIAEQGELFYL